MTVPVGWICFRRQHHGHVDVAGEMGQPFGMTWIGKSCEMKGVLLSRCRNDSVHPAIERQFDGGFHCVSGNPPGANGSTSIRRAVAGAEAPTAHGDRVGRLERCDLVLRPNDGHLCTKW